MTNSITSKLTESQENALEELSKRMSKNEDMNVFKSFNIPFVYYRFLKARDWDVNKAEIMLTKSVQWRKRMLQYKNEPSKVVRRYFSNMHIGLNKGGGLVFYVNLGKCDVKGLLKATKPFEVENYVKQFVMSHELQHEQKYKQDNRLSSYCIIIADLKGMTLANVTNKRGLEIVLRICGLQDHFPERLLAIYVINAPAILNFAINTFMSFLNIETMKKVHVFGTEGWKEVLLAQMDADQLPECLGGKRRDPDGNPRCLTILNQMGPIYESEYLEQSPVSALATAPGVRRTLVPRASSVRIPVHVTDPGSVVEWQFETISGGDIGFALLQAEGDVDLVVIPLERRNSHNGMDSTGMYRCESPGKCE